MARIQILELPEGAADNRPPFLLVIDETSYPNTEAYRAAEGWWQQLAQQVGAQGCIVTDDTINIPGNEITLSDATDGNVVRLRVEPDLTGFHDAVMAEVARAQATARTAVL